MAFTSTLASTKDRLCDPVYVTTTLRAACPACPNGMNVVIIQEDTPYADWQKRVSQQVLAELEGYARTGRNISVGVIHYNGRDVRTALRPTLNLGAARGPLNDFNVAHDPRGLFMEAAQDGVQMVRDGRRLHGNKATPECEFIVFFVYTKVYMQDKGEEMIRAGRTLLREVDNLFVGCPHQHPEECTIWEPQVPRSQRYYTEDPEPSKLRGMVRDALREIDDEGIIQLRTLSIEQTLPLALEVVPDSFNVAPNTSVKDNEQTKLTWSWRLPKMNETITLTYQAEPKIEGVWHSDLRTWLTDNQNRRGERLAVTEPITLVDEVCLPETATPVPTATPLPTSTPTATRTPVPTATATATPTRVPGPIYLPVLVSEQCYVSYVNADVVLVLDISTSMSRPTRSGRSKLAATQDAAKAFVARMDLSPGGRGDQVAVVGFNRQAWIQSPLGTDAARINRAIDDLALRQAEHTRLDLALIGGRRGAAGAEPPGRQHAGDHPPHRRPAQPGAAGRGRHHGDDGPARGGSGQGGRQHRLLHRHRRAAGHESGAAPGLLHQPGALLLHARPGGSESDLPSHCLLLRLPTGRVLGAAVGAANWSDEDSFGRRACTPSATAAEWERLSPNKAVW